ncbi:acylneuraminate cytidylyltransferase [Agromyces humatus]|uniref:N-acylneuraminate cytidylyltransferase n=1 Tax=Agromyces humatus TaxID=279573 RepID=A0ABN2L0X3_9MICO|nr:acylneuraminate cytidylyltransferase [Agromyces humatus]
MLPDGRQVGRTTPPAAGVVAIVPARGGSKGLPGKNLAPVAGVPLITRTIRAAIGASRIDAVFVSTDDDRIADAAHAEGAGVIRRPVELAGDTASSESALLHALDEIAAGAGTLPGTTVFLQATSPFVDSADLDEAVRRVVDGEDDVVFSVVPSHAFLWRDSPDGAEGVNHESSVRPRRQEREPEYRETGAFYVMRTDGFREAGHRFFGRIGMLRVPDAHAIEIDDPADLALARVIARGGLGDDDPVGTGPVVVPPQTARRHVSAGHDGHDVAQRRPTRLIDVDAVVTDFDGVHTDDTAWVDAEGRELVRVSRSDGHGVARLREAGIPVLILSAETNPVVAARAAKLQVEVRHGVAEKGVVLAEWAEARGIRLDRIAYLGNDEGDLPALALVGWPVAVADAVASVRSIARLVLDRRGGTGAVRELAELVVGARTIPESAYADRVVQKQGAFA